MADHIPVADPHAEFVELRKQIEEAMLRVGDRGSYILGEEVRLFEQEFAAYLGAGHCIGVASGTDALALALKAVGVDRSDEVITVSHSAVATAAAIEQIGAVPVFADIDPVTRCMNPACLALLLTKKTKAIVVVHIYGRMAAIESIVELAHNRGIKVIEDCAQAHGARRNGSAAGTFGDAGAFSFYPTKNLGCLGDGGAVVTNDAAIAGRVRMLRQYGWEQRYISSIAGLNSRLDEMQASVLRVKLPHLERNNQRRRALARRYREALSGGTIEFPRPDSPDEHVMHLCVVEVEKREAFERFIAERGIGTARHYPAAIHQQPAYAGRIRGSDSLPVTEALYKRIVSLPMYPQLSDADANRICAALAEWTVAEPMA
jgi:dTDP-4-amino-4,6-dideoxygalactose transaminase